MHFRNVANAVQAGARLCKMLRKSLRAFHTYQGQGTARDYGDGDGGLTGMLGGTRGACGGGEWGCGGR